MIFAAPTMATPPLPAGMADAFGDARWQVVQEPHRNQAALGRIMGFDPNTEGICWYFAADARLQFAQVAADVKAKVETLSAARAAYVPFPLDPASGHRHTVKYAKCASCLRALSRRTAEYVVLTTDRMYQEEQVLLSLLWGIRLGTP